MKKFLATESASSKILLIMVIVAMAVANSPFHELYGALHNHTNTVLINDGLMSLFFLVIGIELKHEVLDGDLQSLGQALLPVVGALGGVALPALIYVSFNDDPTALRGWAIPMATDIAFTLGLLGFFASRIPSSLRVFLMALAVIDDLFAIIVIAVFYTAELSHQALGMAIAITVLLFIYNRTVKRMIPYLFAGAALWLAMFASGIHPTLSAVILGIMMPMYMGRRVMKALHRTVALVVVPIFVFANAGVTVSGLSMENFTHPVSMGIFIGLFVGKQLGIFGAAGLMIASGKAKLPKAVSWMQFYGACVAAGIGFTMSLFIGILAFHQTPLMVETRLGVLAGSFASAIVASILFSFAKNRVMSQERHVTEA